MYGGRSAVSNLRQAIARVVVLHVGALAVGVARVVEVVDVLVRDAEVVPHEALDGFNHR